MNAINWFEIPAADFARACHFYERILAAPIKRDLSFDGVKLGVLPASEEGVGGAIIEMEQARPHADGVRVYLNGGQDLGHVLDRVVAAGGKVVMPKMLIREDIGYIGLFSDLEGNIIGLHSLH